MLKVGAAVVYIGPEDVEQALYHGHPGRVVDTGQAPTHVDVSFVNGTSCSVSPELLVAVDEAIYLTRGRRLVSCLHPVLDSSVPRYNLAGDEWPEGRDPGPAN